MARRHISIYPSGKGPDYLRAERSFDGVWLRSSVASLLPVLLPPCFRRSPVATFPSAHSVPCQWAIRR